MWVIARHGNTIRIGSTGPSRRPRLAAGDYATTAVGDDVAATRLGHARGVRDPDDTAQPHSASGRRGSAGGARARHRSGRADGAAGRDAREHQDERQPRVCGSRAAARANRAREQRRHLHAGEEQEPDGVGAGRPRPACFPAAAGVRMLDASASAGGGAPGCRRRQDRRAGQRHDVGLVDAGGVELDPPIRARPRRGSLWWPASAGCARTPTRATREPPAPRPRGGDDRRRRQRCAGAAAGRHRGCGRWCLGAGSRFRRWPEPLRASRWRRSARTEG